MKLRMDLFYDEQVKQWGYRVPALSIVGTGCESREEAQRLGYEAIRFVLDSRDEPGGRESDTVLFDVQVTSVEAS